LIETARSGDRAAVEELVARGADLDGQGENGRASLD
jgi:hypothetical protein